jgi:hypothetical protein
MAADQTIASVCLVYESALCELNSILSTAQNPLDHRDEVALWITTIMYTLLAVLSLFGSVIGAIDKSIMH